MTNQGLYHSELEHDACGVGFVANIKGVKSHAIISMGLEVLRKLTHRGAVGADVLQGDGAGVLIQIPDKLYRDDLLQQGISLPAYGEYGVGMIFLPQEKASRHACMEEIERAIITEGQEILGWREVPVDLEMPMSEVVRDKMPVIRQVFVAPSRDVIVTDAFERKLYVIRKRSSIAIANLHLRHGQEFYIPSFSARTVVYKGQVLASQVGIFYKDLRDTRTESALILLHQRFSTNTFPRWQLAHPFRYIAHNGEINTLRGNFNWILAREKKISSPILGDDLNKLWPLIFQGQSDSASFDNALELLVMAGYPLAQAMMMMIPEAWERNPHMQPDLKAFYKYHACMMEPWDGPAVVTFTDGRQVGAQLDRNGLRPARYIVTADDLVILASETGALDIPESRILHKWRLEPGKILLIDLEQGRIIGNQELKNTLATAKPYREWVSKISINIDEIPGEATEEQLELPLQQALRVFAYHREDVQRVLRPMALNGIEPTMSMGNDEPLAVLSSRPRVLYDYFRQLFAQVTNPPIDPIRELLVTSLISFIGPKPDLLNIIATAPSMRIEVPSPILTAAQMEKLRHIDRYTSNKFISKELDITYPLEWGARGIEARIASLRAAAVDAVKAGVNILILTDRQVSRERVAIPALLALSSIHLWLVEHGLRTSTGLVVETGSAFNNHHYALLAGYGAEAICPYLALMVVRSLAPDPQSSERYLTNYLHAVDKGLSKIMSKMGISTYMSYIGAQIFEAVGLSQQFVDHYFTNTPTHLEGIGLFEIAEEQVRIHEHAFDERRIFDAELDNGGHLNFRYDGEEHLWTPEAIISLQKAVREDNYQEFKRFTALTDQQSQHLRTLRGLLELTAGSPVALSEVRDSEEDIIRRFTTAAMSIGAISTEAHTALAIAMNRMGGLSNSGEGGEDPRRDRVINSETTLKAVLGEVIEVDQPLHPGDCLKSKVRQVASGRFGVTSDYLAAGELLQIKMAQGAKPGEGGQLPGHKVSEYIGFLRNSVPGIGLVSPPPHHDIYSIEDLAQLIYDLKLANTHADVSVKLVSEVGIGTVAAGVAKCKADHITVSGHDGGTGASPYSSIKFAGSAWEIGLAEVQQTLVLNRLRSRVRLQVDGQIKTGRDVVIGALLGADEFGFGTAPLVALGCLMMRKCHTNTCPAGIATQDPVLRRQFIGRPEYVERYFHFVAREVRELMAELGFRSFDEMVGQVEHLRHARAADTHPKARFLNFEKILFKPVSDETLHQSIRQDHELEQAFDHRFLEQVNAALDSGTRLVIREKVININRSVGTMISGEVARRRAQPEDDFITLELSGRAGQSLGAFLHKGVTVSLEGEANDYVGKGLSGGIIKIFKPAAFKGAADDNIIAGNTCLYGATSGQVYVSGVAGERFAVRNSGAQAVVEGLGEHGCEYMTGGTVVVLGRIGRNFGSGMSGGVAYIYEPTERYQEKLADNDFHISRIGAGAEPGIPLHLGRSDRAILQDALEAHARHTHSARALQILNDFEQELGNFVKIMPNEYIRALNSLNKEQ